LTQIDWREEDIDLVFFFDLFSHFFKKGAGSPVLSKGEILKSRGGRLPLCVREPSALPGSLSINAHTKQKMTKNNKVERAKRASSILSRNETVFGRRSGRIFSFPSFQNR